MAQEVPMTQESVKIAIEFSQKIMGWKQPKKQPNYARLWNYHALPHEGSFYGFTYTDLNQVIAEAQKWCLLQPDFSVIEWTYYKPKPGVITDIHIASLMTLRRNFRAENISLCNAVMQVCLKAHAVISKEKSVKNITLKIG